MIDPSLRARVEAWRDDDPDPVTVAEVDGLLAANDEAGVRERFDRRLEFGTAGLRGPRGAGPNRMNRAVVRRAAAGIGRWLEDDGATGPIVIGRDARHGSADFATDSARVLAGRGRQVLISQSPIPTPLLAYSVTAVGAAAGIMVTASHNPPADNGYKVYAADGAQIIPPADERIADAMDDVASVRGLHLAPADDRRIEPLPAAIVDGYLDAVTAVRRAPSARSPAVAYTPLHGVGGGLLGLAFERCGLAPPAVVPQQAEPDPDFPTVSFPNPEEPGAMDLVLALAEEIGADVAIANDPDADRLGAAVPTPAGWRVLTGDEIGVVLADHVLRHGSGDDRLVATTVVSSSMLAKMAAERGVRFAETLTGFKWLSRAASTRPGSRLVFAYEEALGFAVAEAVHDKDGISAAVLLADLVGELREAGSSIPERLDALARAHGVHLTAQRSTRYPGPAGLDAMRAVMDRMRTDPPRSIGDHPVEEVEDLSGGGRLPPADAIVLRGSQYRVVVRPSGTEPKLKTYVEIVEPVADDVGAARRRARTALDRLAADLAVLVR